MKYLFIAIILSIITFITGNTQNIKKSSNTIKQESKGTCSPNISDINGNVTITLNCENINAEILKESIDKISAALKDIQDRQLTQTEIISILDSMLKAREDESFPCSSSELTEIHNQTVYYCKKFISAPEISSLYKNKVWDIIGKFNKDNQYGRCRKYASRNLALLYRLYGASILFTPLNNQTSIVDLAKDASYWLEKSILLDTTFSDYHSFRQSVLFFDDIAHLKIKDVSMDIFLYHEFRIAMPEVNENVIKAKADKAIQILKGSVGKRSCGTSQQEDIIYLQNFKINDYSIGQLMESQRMYFSGQFPDKYVGGFATVYPNSKNDKKCCSEVWYIFNTDESIVYKWKVCKLKNEIKPLNDKAKEIMTKKGK